MLGKIAGFAVVAAILGILLFWVLTIPSAVPASALPPRSPDLGNGKVMYFAGGCASCHAVPGQEDKTRLGGGLALKSPFGTFYAPNISPDPKNGIGGVYLTQVLPFADTKSLPLYYEFETAVYQSLRAGG